tara:strand:- start:95 stop:1750 length:1656 start_codon:yes stop_codon:yes gene_type:complete
MSIIDTFTTLIPSILSDDMKKGILIGMECMGKQGEKLAVGRGDHKRQAWHFRNAEKENYGISGSKQSLSEMKAFLYPEEKEEDPEDKYPEEEDSSSSEEEDSEEEDSEEEDYTLTGEDLDEIEKKRIISRLIVEIGYTREDAEKLVGNIHERKSIREENKKLIEENDKKQKLINMHDGIEEEQMLELIKLTKQNQELIEKNKELEEKVREEEEDEEEDEDEEEEEEEDEHEGEESSEDEESSEEEDEESFEEGYGWFAHWRKGSIKVIDNSRYTIDEFEEVNKKLSNYYPEEVLKEISERLKKYTYHQYGICPDNFKNHFPDIRCPREILIRLSYSWNLEKENVKFKIIKEIYHQNVPYLIASCERNTVPSYFLAFEQTEFIVTEDYDIVGAYTPLHEDFVGCHVDYANDTQKEKHLERVKKSVIPMSDRGTPVILELLNVFFPRHNGYDQIRQTNHTYGGDELLTTEITPTTWALNTGLAEGLNDEWTDVGQRVLLTHADTDYYSACSFVRPDLRVFSKSGKECYTTIYDPKGRTVKEVMDYIKKELKIK